MADAISSDMLWYIAGAFPIAVGILGFFFPRSGNIIEALRDLKRPSRKLRP